jgi:hypothetical protein
MTGTGQLLVEIGHLDPGDVQQTLMLLQTFAQVLSIDDDCIGGYPGIEAMLVAAASPGSERKVIDFGRPYNAVAVQSGAY